MCAIGVSTASAFHPRIRWRSPDPARPELGDHPIVRVPLRAGEIVIWKWTMLHGNGRNTSHRLRLAQYVYMNPVPTDESERAELRAKRIASWRGNEPAPGDPFPGDQRRLEQERVAPADLAELGKRLIGLQDWE